jgi:hypothetical protein
MSYTYSQYQTDLANLLVVPATDPNFLTVLPNIIDDAEQRIYRELDLLNTVVHDTTGSFSTGTRSFTLPSSIGTFVVVDTIYAITPFGAASPDAGTRNTLLPASRPYLDATFPSSTASTVPKFFAMTTQTTVIVGPWPDQAYQAEVVGTVRPTPLSNANQTTILTTYLPDLFMAASLVFGAGYLKNFGAMSDDPKSGMSWESHFQELLKSASIEEARKKFTSQGWSSKQPSPLATPPRT